MTNLLGLAVRLGQRVLGKQNHSASVTPGPTPGQPRPPLLLSSLTSSWLPGRKPVGPSCIRQTWESLDWHTLWKRLSPCLPLLNQ